MGLSINSTLNCERERNAAGRWMLDPLDHSDSDEHITLTLRQVVRIALVASEVGARFQRDDISTDPMAWMLAPRRAFHGLPPVEACMSQRNCVRAVLIHGLGLDLNISSGALDSLMDDERHSSIRHFEAID
jgi:hypothetical protein